MPFNKVTQVAHYSVSRALRPTEVQASCSYVEIPLSDGNRQDCSGSIDAKDRRIQQEEDEELVVGPSDTVANPRTCNITNQSAKDSMKEYTR